MTDNIRQPLINGLLFMNLPDNGVLKMNRIKINRKLISLIIMCSVVASITSCAQEEEEETHERETTTTTVAEETTEGSTEATSEETVTESETETETSVEETEPEQILNMDRQACSNEEDDARYMSYLLNDFPAYAEETWIDRNFDAQIAYVDLDADGADELLVGVSDEYGSGVFCVVTEVDGEYHKTDVYGWAIQQGALPGSYCGNGYFIGHIDNGNNYGHEAQIDCVYEYDAALRNCGVVARYSTIYHNSGDGSGCTLQLYTIAGEDSIMSDDIYAFTPDDPKYIYETGEYELFEVMESDLAVRYTEIEDSCNICDDPYSVLEWRPITEVIG